MFNLWYFSFTKGRFGRNYKEPWSTGGVLSLLRYSPRDWGFNTHSSVLFYTLLLRLNNGGTKIFCSSEALQDLFETPPKNLGWVMLNHSISFCIGVVDVLILIVIKGSYSRSQPASTRDFWHPGTIFLAIFSELINFTGSLWTILEKFINLSERSVL